MKKENKGITLIALVITIIVMLILVGVTITMAVNGGLFEKAGEAASKTNNAVGAEQALSNGAITVGDKYYNSIGEYMKEIQKTLIQFTIDNEPRFNTKEENIVLYAKEGMTWEQWITSEYNTEGYVIKDGKIVESSESDVSLSTEYGSMNSVGQTEEIIKDGIYYFSMPGDFPLG